MTPKTLHTSHRLITEHDRIKASIKYELNYLRYRLRKLLNKSLNKHDHEIKLLCTQIANHYLDYLHLVDGDIRLDFDELIMIPCHREHFLRIQNLEQQFAQAELIEAKKTLLVDIVTLYKMTGAASAYSTDIEESSTQLRYLFSKSKIDLWLNGLIDFWNRYEPNAMTLSTIFHYWTIAQQQLALKFFMDKQFVDIVNAIFFYKLYPDQLFSQIPHPEKLVSARSRLGILHYYIEQIQQQLYAASVQNGLGPNIDYLLHGDGLPEGIVLDVDESSRELIRTAIKQLKVCHTLQNKCQKKQDFLHDLRAAYKFWFNPNRLIDVAMGLCPHEEPQTDINLLFSQLTTTECLDFYGYFANNDSRYLLYTFYAITQGVCFDWLPELQLMEKRTVSKVFHALLHVMNALRTELHERRVITKPYVYHLTKERIHIGHRNRDAVFWALAIYGERERGLDDSIEQLFNLAEDVT